MEDKIMKVLEELSEELQAVKRNQEAITSIVTAGEIKKNSDYVRKIKKDMKMVKDAIIILYSDLEKIKLEDQMIKRYNRIYY